MASAPEAQGAGDLLEAFLRADFITPSLVRETLEALVYSCQDAAITENDRRGRLGWVSMAALHTFVQPPLAAKLSSVDAVSSLLGVALRASRQLLTEPSKGTEDGSAGTDSAAAEKTNRSVRTSLGIMSQAWDAWQKTGMGAHTQTDSVGLSGGLAGAQDEDEDEDSAWFDTSAATPSPQPPTSPSLPLLSLVTALAEPIELASLLAPYPQRLAIWLKHLSHTLYTKAIWPRRFEAVKAGLAYHAVAGSTSSTLNDYLREGLLPSTGEDGHEKDLWTELSVPGAAAPSQVDGDLVDQDLIASFSTPDLIETYQDSPLDSAHIGDFFYEQVQTLSETYGATQLASRLADISAEQASQLGAVTTASEELVKFRDASRVSDVLSGVSGQTHTLRSLLTDPASVIATSLSQAKPDLAALNFLLAYASSETGQDRCEIARRVVWKTSANSKCPPRVLDNYITDTWTEPEEVQTIGMSLVLSSSDSGRCSDFLHLLDRVPNGSPTVTLPSAFTRLFPALKLQDNGRLSSAPSPPSAEALYGSLKRHVVGEPEAFALLSARCHSFAEATAAPTVQGPNYLGDALSQQHSWIPIVAATTPELQTGLLNTVTASFKESSRGTQAWLDFHDQIARFAQPPSLFNALSKGQASRLVLRAALSSNDGAHVFQPLVQRSSLDAAEVEGVLIEAATDLYDRASAGRAGVAQLKKVRECLSHDAESSSANITGSLSFLTATLRLMQLSSPIPSSLHPSLPMSPLEIRLAKDKLAIIRRWLSSGSDGAWRREDDALETAWGLCAGSAPGMLGSPQSRQGNEAMDASQIEESTPRDSAQGSVPSKQCIKVQVLAMLADAAVSHGDLKYTGQYVESMLQTLKAMVKRARRTSDVASANALKREVEQAQETVWTTLFSMSKHPHCASADAELTKRWLAEAVAFAPRERVGELLKRWKTLAKDSTNQEEEDTEVAALASAARIAAALEQQRNGGARGLAGIDASAAVNAASGLGAGVFNLAAAAVNRSHWPLSFGSRGASENALPSSHGAVHGSNEPGRSLAQEQQASSAAYGFPGGLPFGGTGVSSALSSLAGHIGEGYGSRLTGFLGSGGAGARQSGEMDRGTVPTEAGGRSAAALFDGFDSSSNPSQNQSRTLRPGSATASPSLGGGAYLDPAERAARAARGFLSGLRGAASNSRPSSSEGGMAGASGSRSGDGGWSSLSSRGMGWLMGDEDRGNSG